MTDQYRFAVAMYNESGRSLEQVPVEVDWVPAEEWARFSAIRKDELAPSDSRAIASVEPIWHPELGTPYTSGFRVRVHGERDTSAEFSADYFRDLAERESDRLIDRSKLNPGESFRYLVAAFPAESTPRAGGRLCFETEDLSPALPLREGTLEEVLTASTPRGSIVDGDMPVFIPARILSEASALARQAGTNETGGIFVGHLHRDRQVPEVYAEVTGQIPAQHARGESTSLSFTARTWTEVQSALELRGRDEIMLGWWHSHPVHHWCKDCPIDRRRNCALASDFFSEQDRALHRTVFPGAYTFALVVNGIASDEHTESFFGWRNGVLESRGFHVLNDLEPDVEPPRPRAA
jgi:proteasome lid subunit RPN8/RPN11